MNRSECLHAATKCVCGQREQDYGKPEDNFGTIGILWSTYLRAAHPDLAAVMGVNRIDAKDVAVMMALLKIARIATGSTEDSFVDLAGYAACAAEIATGGPYPGCTAIADIADTGMKAVPVVQAMHNNAKCQNCALEPYCSDRPGDLEAPCGYAQSAAAGSMTEELQNAHK